MFKLWEWNGFYLGDVILAAFIFIGILLLQKFFAQFLLKQLEKFSIKDESVFDEETLANLESPLKFLSIVLGFYLAVLILNLPVSFEKKTLMPFIRSLLVFNLFWIFYYSVEPLSFIIKNLNVPSGPKLSYGLKSLFVDGTELTEGIKHLLIKGTKIIIVLIGLAAILNEWGISIIALLASLGVAGAALALAAKDILSNFFSSLSIIFDKNFKPGDWIVTSEIEGIVEEIGSRNTKIRTFDNAIVILPNAILTHSPVTNLGEMTNRHIKMRIGLEYGTRHEQVARILQSIKNYLQNHPKIETGLSMTTSVHLVEFNDSSIDILLYYFTKTIHWQEWMRIREENMLEFMKIIENEGAHFAFPNKPIYLEKQP